LELKNIFFDFLKMKFNSEIETKQNSEMATVVMGLEVLAVANCHLTGSGVGYMLQANWQSTIRTRVVLWSELDQLLELDSYPYDMIVAEQPDQADIGALKRLQEKFADSPMLILSTTGDNGYLPDSSGLKMVSTLPVKSNHDEYKEALSRTLGLANVQIKSSAELGDHGAKAQEINVAVRLTARQKDVLRLMVRGLSNKEIAKELNLSPGTVKLHVSALLKAMNLRTRNQVQANVSAQARLSSPMAV
jgi:DNA-binding NarL/FixJ family response regulator